jgi:hypothetical protein
VDEGKKREEKKRCYPSRACGKKSEKKKSINSINENLTANVLPVFTAARTA